MTKFDTYEQVIAERERLRAINAELVAALEALLSLHSGLLSNRPEAAPKVNIILEARATLAKAKGG